MEGCHNLIQSIDGLDHSQKALIIDGLCQTLVNTFHMSKQQALDFTLLGETYTVIGVKVLEILNALPGFFELLDYAKNVQSNSDLFKIAFKTHPDQFLLEVIENTFQFPLSTQQCLLDILENDSERTEKCLQSLVVALKKLKKSDADKVEISICTHHRTASVLLSKKPELIEVYLSNLYEDKGELLSNHLIYYENILSESFFTEVVIGKLEQELLQNDLNIRKNAAALLKKANKLRGISLAEWGLFWDIYESLENYNKGLVASLWKRIYSLFAWDMSKIQLLFARAKGHENLTVRRFIAKNYMKQTEIDTEFTVTSFIDYLSDPGLYSDSMELVGKSQFGIKISEFFTDFIKKSKSKDAFTVTFIKKVFEKIEFQVGFRYFAEAIMQIYEDQYLDSEILQKAYNVTSNQMTQLTPFYRHESMLLMKRLLESNTEKFVFEKMHLASKVPFVCNIQVNLSEASEIIEKAINSRVAGEKKVLSSDELGILFCASFQKQNLVRLVIPLFQSLQSIYRSTYLKVDLVKVWVESLYCIMKRLNQQTSESLRVQIIPVLDELFAYALSITDPDIVDLFSKTLYVCIENIGPSHLAWSLTKLSNLRDLISTPTQQYIYSHLKYTQKLLKFVSKFNQIELVSIGKDLTNFISEINERKLCARDMFQRVTPLKWKILSLLSESNPGKITSQAVEILENSSLSMLENVFNILAKGFIPSASEQEVEEICYQAWKLILETKNDAPLSILVSFARLAFNQRTIDLNFTPNLFAEVLAVGKDRWGIVRILLYECVPIWVKFPEKITKYVESIYQLTIYDEPRACDSEFLTSCLFALINCPKPHIQGDPATLRSQYIRILILFVIEKVTSNDVFVRILLEKCFEGLYRSCQDRGEFPNSLIYKKKVRLGQLLCCLCPWVSNHANEDSCKLLISNLIELLKIPYVHSARQYIERFLVVIMVKSPYFTDCIELDYDMRPQLAGSYIIILGCVMVFTTNQEIRQKIFTNLLPFMISNTAHIRRIAHLVMFKLVQNFPEFQEKSTVFKFLINNKECAKMMKRLENLILSFDSFGKCDLKFILTGYFSEFDEILHSSLVSEIEEKTKKLLDTSDEVNFSEVWKGQAENLACEHVSIPNFQRKVEDTPALIELRLSKGVQKRHELIIVASLIDKIPNLAGLTRTSEVFNLQMITVAYRNIMHDPEFKSMAVTADKWVPIMEVPKTEIEKFLRLYRHNHYQIIGLEQTANSVTIENYKFVSKTVLVLGNEKDGIPGELLPLLDACIEIPQFGLIRSLNVHVSGSICIWEYIKQLYVKND